MVGIADREHPLASEPHEVVRMWQHRGDVAAVRGADEVGDRREVEVGRRLVDDDEDLGNLELRRHSRRDPGALEVLAVRTHDDQEDVGDDQREEGLFIEARVGVDEEDVERQLLDELAQPGGQALGVVPLAQDPGDLAGLHARGDEEQPAPIDPADAIGDVEGDVLDRPVMPEEVVERRVTRLTGQTEEDVDARRLDIGVDHPDPEAACGDDRSQIRRGIRLPRPTPKGVDADDGRHPALRDQSRPAIEHTRSSTRARDRKS